MKHTGDASTTDCDLDVDIAGEGEETTVDPGETVTVAYAGRVWSRPGCPACIDQVVIGLEDDPFVCGYHGIPGIHPGREFSGSFSFDAPSEKNVYKLYALVASKYTCIDAKRWYRERPELRFQIGTLGVGVAVPIEWERLAMLAFGTSPLIVVTSVVGAQELTKRG